jgi:hypothetical protein
MNKDTGGPAFPQSENTLTAAPGMTLRDWFAGQALAGFCANTDIAWSKQGVGSHIAQECWKQADAMIAERASHDPHK